MQPIQVLPSAAGCTLHQNVDGGMAVAFDLRRRIDYFSFRTS